MCVILSVPPFPKSPSWMWYRSPSFTLCYLSCSSTVAGKRKRTAATARSVLLDEHTQVACVRVYIHHTHTIQITYTSVGRRNIVHVYEMRRVERADSNSFAFCRTSLHLSSPKLTRPRNLPLRHGQFNFLTGPYPSLIFFSWTCPRN